jgi:hypothetical protein
MTILTKRIDKLEHGGPRLDLAGLGLAEQLDAAIGKPPLPLLPPSPNATRTDHRIWRSIAEGRARVIHTGGLLPSPFRDLSEIYSMTDIELLEAINARP